VITGCQVCIVTNDIPQTAHKGSNQGIINRIELIYLDYVDGLQLPGNPGASLHCSAQSLPVPDVYLATLSHHFSADVLCSVGSAGVP